MAVMVQATGRYRPRHLYPTNAMRKVAFVTLRALQVLVTFAVLSLIASFAIGGLVLHMGLSPVLTGSMRPTYAPGDAIVTRWVDVHSLHKGDIAVFVPPGESTPFAHRITSVTEKDGHVVVTTKGDANQSVDRWHAKLNAERVRVVVGTVPHFGSVMAATHKPWTRAIGIGLVGLALTAIGTSAIVRGSPQPRRTQAPALS